MKGNGKNNVSAWIVIGVIVLIVLLIVWLTIADFWGDTDVAAFNTIEPATNLLKNILS